MTMRELQTRLARIARDLNEVALELYDRRFEEDWMRIEGALDRVSDTCYGFLDEESLDSPALSAENCRLEPGAIGIELRNPSLFSPADVDKGVVPIQTPARKKAPGRAA